MLNLKSNFLSHFFALAIFLLLVLLLARNPFSTRTLIPNLEPFPDTFHYISPPLCAVQGYGWKMCLKNLAGRKTDVSPLYSIWLLPFFTLKNDPRMFYIANIFLSLSTYFVFYLLIKKIFKKWWIHGVLLFVFATNYYTYWYPSLAMAENLTTLLILLCLHLSIAKPNFKNVLLSIVAGVSLYATKLANLPLFVSFLGLNILKTSYFLRQKRNFKFYILSLVASGIGILIGIYVMNSSSLVSGLNSIRYTFLGQFNPSYLSKTDSWLSFQYWTTNFKFYVDSLIGQNTKVLWHQQQLYPLWLALGSSLGFTISFIKRRYRFLTITIFSVIASHAILISFFFSNDARYFLYVIPMILIGFGYYLEYLLKIFNRFNQYKPAYLFLIIIGFGYFLGVLIPVKNQIMLNLRHSETPWWYLATLEMNAYFENDDLSTSKPYLITLSSPFFIDYYGNNHYQPLPLSEYQDFKGTKQEVWGIDQKTELVKTYQELIDQQQAVYVTNYGVNASQVFRDEYAKIQSSFKYKLVKSGCYDLCNIYLLSSLD